MLTLAELGKRTRLGTRTLEATQCAVNRLIFLDADRLAQFVYIHTQNRKDIISNFRVNVNYFFP